MRIVKKYYRGFLFTVLLLWERIKLAWEMRGFDKMKVKADKMTKDHNKTYTVIKVLGKWRILNNFEFRRYKREHMFQKDVNFQKLRDKGYYVTR